MIDERIGRQPVVLAARAGLGTSQTVWMVGGALRDALLDTGPLRDLDLVVSGDAAMPARAVARASRRPAFPLS